MTLKDVLGIFNTRFDWTTLLEDSRTQVCDMRYGSHIRENGWNDGKGDYILGGDIYLDMTQDELLNLPVVETDMDWHRGRVTIYVELDSGVYNR